MRYACVAMLVLLLLLFVLGTWYCEAMCMLCRYIECQCFTSEFLALRHDHFLAKVMPNFCRDNLCLHLKTLISCVAMSSSGNQNVDGDVARSSSRQIDMEEQYRLMALESQ
jgi:hypothetical protein